MTLILYKIIVTIYDSKSFQKAANILHITPSAISHSISKCEKELGFSLFIRHKHGVTATSSLENLIPYIRNILKSNDYLLQKISETKGSLSGTVRIGCFNSVCTNWIPELIHSFNISNPDINIEIFQGSYKEIKEWIKSGIVDFGFLSVSSSEGVQIEPLYKDELVCVMPKNYINTKKQYVHLEEIKDDDFVIQREGCDDDIQNYLISHNLKIKSDYHVTDDLSTVSLVSHGLGICLMPKLVMNDVSYPVDTYKLIPSAHRTIGLSFIDKASFTPAAKKLYNFILEYRF